jgi:hypothetical protein
MNKGNLSIEAHFIETAPENPVLWTGMKGASAKGGKNNEKEQNQTQIGKK